MLRRKEIFLDLVTPLQDLDHLDLCQNEENLGKQLVLLLNPKVWIQLLALGLQSKPKSANFSAKHREYLVLVTHFIAFWFGLIWRRKHKQKNGTKSDNSNRRGSCKAELAAKRKKSSPYVTPTKHVPLHKQVANKILAWLGIQIFQLHKSNYTLAYNHGQKTWKSYSCNFTVVSCFDHDCIFIRSAQTKHMVKYIHSS